MKRDIDVQAKLLDTIRELRFLEKHQIWSIYTIVKLMKLDVFSSRNPECDVLKAYTPHEEREYWVWWMKDAMIHHDWVFSYGEGIELFNVYEYNMIRAMENGDHKVDTEQDYVFCARMYAKFFLANLDYPEDRGEWKPHYQVRRIIEAYRRYYHRIVLDPPDDKDEYGILSKDHARDWESVCKVMFHLQGRLDREFVSDILTPLIIEHDGWNA